MAYYGLSLAWKDQFKETHSKVFNSSGQGSRVGPGFWSAPPTFLNWAKLCLPWLLFWDYLLQDKSSSSTEETFIVVHIGTLSLDSYALNSTCLKWDSHMDLAHTVVTLLFLSSELMKPLKVKSPMKPAYTRPKIQCKYRFWTHVQFKADKEEK